VEILLPKTDENWHNAVHQIASIKPLQPFDEISFKFVQGFSNYVLTNTARYDKYSELNIVARWMNKDHLEAIRTSYEFRRQNRVWLPRGNVLHFTPANVDTLFIHSLFLSLLLGNINVVRVSKERSEQLEAILEVLNYLIEQECYKEIRKRNLVMSYDHDESITRELSQYCHVRVIWGGDGAVRQIREIPLPPRSIELVFADRFSMTAFNADSLLQVDKQEIDALCKDFYFDTFRFSQRACSSPRLILWVGETEQIKRAQNIFWSALENFARQKEIIWEEGDGMRRAASGYWYAARGIADKLSTAKADFPYRVHVEEFKKGFREMHSGGGVFLEIEKTSLMEIIESLTCKDQTLGVYGFSKETLEKFAWQLGGYGIDRIVPVGQALLFQTIWDGYDMFTYLTREVTVEGRSSIGTSTVI